MADEATRSIERHYTRGKLLERVLAALSGAGLDVDHLRVEDLYAIDQLHGGGLAATKEHARRSGITAAMHVLDVGCGIGGSARYLAATIGCQVTGVDLTAEFVEVARELTARCSLADRVTFERADATELPFADATFDHVWSHNVTMNVRDKAAFAAEVARVLVPGGRFTCVEYAKGPRGSPTFPLSWARDPSQSFLVTPEEMRAALEAGGLNVLEQVTVPEGEASTSVASTLPATSVALTSAVVMGEDSPERQRNRAKSSRDGALVDQFIVASKPGPLTA
jgi:SAM-dependent methyltransferase